MWYGSVAMLACRPQLRRVAQRSLAIGHAGGLWLTKLGACAVTSRCECRARQDRSACCERPTLRHRIFFSRGGRTGTVPQVRSDSQHFNNCLTAHCTAIASLDGWDRTATSYNYAPTTALIGTLTCSRPLHGLSFLLHGLHKYSRSTTQTETGPYDHNNGEGTRQSRMERQRPRPLETYITSPFSFGQVTADGTDLTGDEAQMLAPWQR